MRLPRESILFICLATALSALVCVVVGIYTGSIVDTSIPRASATPRLPTATSQPAPTNHTPSPPELAASPSPVGAQRSMIIIGVDDAQAAAPQLEGVWVLSFQPGINVYYVTSLAPSAEFHLASLSGELAMRDIFAEDQRLQLGFHFMRDAVEARFSGFRIDADVVLDRDDFSGLVTSVGGLNPAGQVLAGSDLLNNYDLYPVDDYANRMFFQEQVFTLLFNAFGAQAWTPDSLVKYVEQLPQVQADPARQAALDAFIAGAPSLADSTLIWRNYQPEMEIGATP